MKTYKCKKCCNKIHKNTFIYGSSLCGSCSLTGKKKSKQHRANISKSRKELLKDPTKHPRFGKRNPNAKSNQKYYCPKCGKEITTGSKMCRSCSHLGKPSPMLGKKQSKITIEKRRKKLVGKKRTEKTKSKISLGHGGTGIPYENNKYPSEFTKSLRREIRERDNNTCQHCGMTQAEHFKKYNRDIEIHHIDYCTFNNNKDNLITLCKQCNSQANFNRDYWFAFYTYKLQESNC